MKLNLREAVYTIASEGLRNSLADFTRYVDEGKHREAACVLADLAMNCKEAAYRLAEVLALETMDEYVAAGGKMPASREESQALAKKLFPRDMNPVSPTRVALEARGDLSPDSVSN